MAEPKTTSGRDLQHNRVYRNSTALSRESAQRRIRRRVVAAAVAFIVGVLAGCSSASGSGSSPSSHGPSTRTLKHALGTSTIPTHPKRIVTLDIVSEDALLALGTKPIGTTTITGTMTAEQKKESAGITLVGTSQQPNMEKIASLNPDLIVGTKGIMASIYKQLSQIAPTVATDFTAAQWKQSFLYYADMIGKTSAAKSQLAAYAKRVSQMRDKYKNALTSNTISVIRARPGNAVRIYFKGSFPGSVLDDLGIQRPSGQVKLETKKNVVDNGGNVDVTKESFAIIDSDILFAFAFNATEEQALSQLQKDPLWSQLTAVRNHKAYIVSAAWLSVGIAGANQILDDVSRSLNG